MNPRHLTVAKIVGLVVVCGLLVFAFISYRSSVYWRGQYDQADAARIAQDKKSEAEIAASKQREAELLKANADLAERKAATKTRIVTIEKEKADVHQEVAGKPADAIADAIRNELRAVEAVRPASKDAHLRVDVSK